MSLLQQIPIADSEPPAFDPLHRRTLLKFALGLATTGALGVLGVFPKAKRAEAAYTYVWGCASQGWYSDSQTVCYPAYWAVHGHVKVARFKGSLLNSVYLERSEALCRCVEVQCFSGSAVELGGDGC
jgi:hypothetical protein